MKLVFLAVIICLVLIGTLAFLGNAPSYINSSNSSIVIILVIVVIFAFLWYVGLNKK